MGFSLTQKTIASAAPEPISTNDLYVSQALIQVHRENSSAVEVGPGAFDVDKGIQLAAPTEGEALPYISIVPTSPSNDLNLKNWNVRGPVGHRLNVLYEEH